MTKALLTGCLSLLLLAGLTANQAMAQATSQPAAKPHRGGGAHHPFAILKKLGLTDDQKAQVKAIVQQAHKDAKAATDKGDKMKIWKAAFEKIKTSVLTDAQRKKLAELRANHKKHHTGSNSAPTT